MIESDTHNYYNENTYTVRYGVNSAASWNKETDEVTANLPTGGFLDQSRTRYDVLTIRNQLNFNHTFAEKHAVAIVAGIETIDRRYQSFGYPRTYGYNDETLSVGNFPNGIGGTGVYQLTDWQGNNLTMSYQNSFSYTTDRYFSAFGNASYTYDSRYTVSGSVRTDASNLITDDPAYRYARSGRWAPAGKSPTRHSCSRWTGSTAWPCASPTDTTETWTNRPPSSRW